MIISKSFSTHDAAKRMIDDWAQRYLGSASGSQERSERLAATAAMVAKAMDQELAFLDAAEHEPPDPSQQQPTAETPAAPAALDQKPA
jgi:hypothetical protein